MVQELVQEPAEASRDTTSDNMAVRRELERKEEGLNLDLKKINDAGREPALRTWPFTGAQLEPGPGVSVSAGLSGPVRILTELVGLRGSSAPQLQ